MQEKYPVANHLVGIIHIDSATGALSWSQKDLDPVVQRYVKRYLVDEGFIEKALGMLDPVMDRELTALLNSLTD
jgi:hypothetical protein